MGMQGIAFGNMHVFKGAIFDKMWVGKGIFLVIGLLRGAYD